MLTIISEQKKKITTDGLSYCPKKVAGKKPSTAISFFCDNRHNFE
jgi:hypothetical protein